MPSMQYFNQSAPFWDFVANFEEKAFQDPKGDKNGEEKETPAGEQTGCPGRPSRFGDGPCGRGPRSGRGGWGGRGPRGPHGPPPFAMHPFAQFFTSQLDGEGADGEAKDFRPSVDVFTTESSYHVHVSLPGAKKEDIGLNWNADKSELSIAGVVYRPGDEDFLKTLAMGERKVGVFDRKVRLGNDRHPADVDADGITAKLEDGVLRVEVPKVEREYVDIKKVDIE